MVEHGELDILQPPLHQDWPVAASVRMPMARVEHASLAWVNWALAEEDPVFSALGRDEDAYRSHLIDQCAYRVTSPGHGEHFAAADRYGGRGLAGNGGAGRAAFLNQYYVKGVGRTPLLGLSDDFSHASGDAYLEEAVREAIFAEIFHAECPFGAVRTLAIMTYGQSVFWDAVDKTETLALVIRRRFTRIGHFARALGFKSVVERDGSADEARVEHMLMRFREAKGSDGVFRWLNRVGEAAAMQLGYFFAHRLNQGSPTLSNWSCNGAILDFGAASSIPSYRHMNLDPVGGGLAYPNNVHGLIGELAGLFRQVELHLGASADPFDHARVVKAYTAQVHAQLLRIIGFSSQQISAASAAERQAFGQAADAFIATEQQSTVDLLQNTDASGEWNRYDTQFDTLARCLHAVPAHPRSLLRSVRPQLCREDVKDKLYLAVDSNHKAASERDVAHVISSWVARNRRDTRTAARGSRPVGFAVSAHRSLAIHRDGAQLLGIDETTGGWRPLGDWQHADPALVTHLVEFGDRSPEAEGCPV